MVRVVIVGAGVIGLSTALHLLERFPAGAFNLNIHVVSEKFSPNTTSNKAGALMVQGCAPNAGPEVTIDPETDMRMQNWTKATMQRLHSIYRSEENAQVQICVEQGYFFLDAHLPDPWYKDEVFGFHHVEVDSAEASLMHVPSNCVDVWSFGTYVMEPTLYLNWLMDKIRGRGATFEQRKISSLDELSSYDIIINCTGLGSRDLLDDSLVHPVCGQVVLAKAPWIKHWLAFSGWNSIGYVVPRTTNVVLGGTAIADNWSETPDIETAESILKNCQQHFPSLCGAKVVGGWVGLRPFRDPIRLESCEGPAGSLLVHCYGHGGQGVLLSWGCAVDIGDIVQQRL